MAKKFQVSIITPDRTFFDGETDMLVVKGTEGYFGVMDDYQPSVVPLAIGSLKIKNNDGSYSVAASGSGLFTLRKSKVRVLLDSAEWIDEIDLERAKKAKERAEQRLNTPNREDIDYRRAKASLDRAVNRIKHRKGEK